MIRQNPEPEYAADIPFIVAFLRKTPYKVGKVGADIIVIRANLSCVTYCSGWLSAQRVSPVTVHVVEVDCRDRIGNEVEHDESVLVHGLD